MIIEKKSEKGRGVDLGPGLLFGVDGEDPVPSRLREERGGGSKGKYDKRIPPLLRILKSSGKRHSPLGITEFVNGRKRT